MLWRRLAYLLPWRRRAAERDMEEELRSLAAMAQPGELGNLTLAAEDARAEWGWTRLEQALQDLRYAGRTLRRTPGFTATAVLSLALGIGATAAMFSVLDAVLLRPLPFDDANRLVRILEHRPPDATGELGYPQQLASIAVSDLPALRSQATTLSHIGGYAGTTMTLAGRDGPVRVPVTRVSPSVFAMLGVAPRLGRLFEPRAETAGLDSSVILSHAAWQRYFASSPDVISKGLTLEGRDFAVLGVMPEGFRFPDPQTELWIPYALSPRGRITPIARLADGVSLEAATAQVNGILSRLASTRPGRKPSSFEVQTMHALLTAPVKPAFVAFAVAVAAVLLIACVNVASLLLARAAARRRELAVRLALGAGRGRLARQLAAENLLLALGGGAIGTLLAAGWIRLLRVLGTALPRPDLTPAVSVPRVDEVAIDPFVLLATMAIALATTLLFGMVPVLRLRLLRPGDDLRGVRSSSQANLSLFRPHRGRGLLVAGQIALALLLLVGAGLLVRSFGNLLRVHPGYDAHNLLTFTVPAAGRMPPSFADDVAERLRTLPGVVSVGYAELMPMVRFRSGIPIKPAQATARAGTPPGPIDARIVSRDFLTALGVPIVAGRGFRAEDREGQPRVLLINRTLARTGYLGDRPLGARVQAGPFQWEVVGIVEDVHQYGLDQQPDAQVYFDARQLPAGNPSPYFAVRVERSPTALVASIRDAVRELNRLATIDNVATMEQVVSNSLSRPRLFAVLLGAFAGIASLLALVGVYGLIAWSVAERTREFGIRIALGATGRNVIALVLRQTAWLIAAGLLAGLLGAAALTRYLQGLLFGLGPLDATTFAIAALAFAAVAMLASYVPGRRATEVNPVVALRSE